MQITVYSGFSKRVNSTKRPSGGRVIDNVRLKNQTNIKSPVFELDTLDFNINYVQAFGNYYYCDVNNLDGHRSELICKIDRHATFKNQIGAYKGLIEYCSNSEILTITDPRNTPTAEMIHAHTDLAWSAGSASFNETGTYILAFMSDKSGGSGLVKYAAFDWYALSQFAAEFFSQSIIDELVKQFTNPTDALVSLMWIPISYSDVPGTVTSNLTVGRESITLSDSQCKVISDRTLSLESSAVVSLVWPSLPYTFNIRNTYIAKAPYTTMELFLPFVGNVPLSDDLIAWLDSGFKITGAIDILTGDVVYIIWIGSEKAAIFNGNCATQMPIGSASYNAFGVVSGAMTVVGGLATAAGVAFTGGAASVAIAGVGAAAGGAASAAKSAVVHTQINGSNSSAVGAVMGLSPRITIYTSVAAETDITAYKSEQGLPYFKVDTVSKCGGYVKTHNASVSIPGDGEEQSAVNALMNEGFYYE